MSLPLDPAADHAFIKSAILLERLGRRRRRITPSTRRKGQRYLVCSKGYCLYRSAAHFLITSGPSLREGTYGFGAYSYPLRRSRRFSPRRRSNFSFMTRLGLGTGGGDCRTKLMAINRGLNRSCFIKCNPPPPPAPPPGSVKPSLMIFNFYLFQLSSSLF